jgi:hypothetical protein
MQHRGIQPGLGERTATDLLFALLSPELQLPRFGVSRGLLNSSLRVQC